MNEENNFFFDLTFSKSQVESQDELRNSNINEKRNRRHIKLMLHEKCSFWYQRTRIHKKFKHFSFLLLNMRYIYHEKSGVNSYKHRLIIHMNQLIKQTNKTTFEYFFFTPPMMRVQ